ncbi:MAG: exopolyphosphatase [Anaerorhabdus sp.]|uniref:exopolyphosphatase n=1 Tax=Anaerorhabdus sp. TaxID=1872524 RepID=UPI002FCC7F34
MRLITRSDFDGLACAVLLKYKGIVDSWKFVHPKDLQDGIVEIGQDDCLANVPYVKGCGLWFDHHSSETERNAYKGKYIGESRLCPSCAHVIYDYYGGAEAFPNFEAILDAVDKVDSANLTIDEILHPKDWVLLGFIMDPRTGLGRFRNFRISNYQLMEDMITYCADHTIEDILGLPDVQERVELYWQQNDMFIKMVQEHTHIENKTVISDLRGVDPIYAGNRFLIYSLYPEANLSVWIVNGKGGLGCSAAVGYSVLNKTCTMDVGNLMLKYGGGGHKVVGTCQFTDEEMNTKLESLIDEIKVLNK